VEEGGGEKKKRTQTTASSRRKVLFVVRGSKTLPTTLLGVAEFEGLIALAQKTRLEN
jgi:hypothetical protein